MTRMNELAAFLKAHDDYGVFGHVSPDGDAAGSALALALALRAMGKRAFVYLPGGLPGMYRGFAHAAEIASCAEEMPFKPKTGFAVDVSEAARLGDGWPIFEACADRAALDHHATNPGFGQVCVIDGQAAASGELAVELICALGVEMSAEMADWLYIAICTDSGRFGYSSTRAQTMEAAARCLAAGADVDRIVRELYCTRSEGRTRLLGLVLSGLERSADGEMCWARLSEAMLADAHALREDNEGIVNYLLEIRGTRFACLAEQKGAQTKFSLRSKAGLDVAAQIAVPLGGGGHARAAGVTLNMDMEAALDCVLKRAREALDFNRRERE